MTSQESPQVAIRICGALISGPQPIGTVDLPLNRGCHALYGLNGAGKSRLLSELGKLLRCGDVYDSYLYGRVEYVESSAESADLNPRHFDELVGHMITSRTHSVSKYIRHDYYDPKLMPQLMDHDQLETSDIEFFQDLLACQTYDSIYLDSGGRAVPDLDRLRGIAAKNWIIFSPSGDHKWHPRLGLVNEGEVELAEEMAQIHASLSSKEPSRTMASLAIGGENLLANSGGFIGCALLDGEPSGLLERLALLGDTLDNVVPIPVSRCLEHDDGLQIDFFTVVEDEDLEISKIDSATSSLGRRLVKHPQDLIVARNDEVSVSQVLVDVVERIQLKANQLYERFTGSIDSLSCNLRAPFDWYWRPPIEWCFNVGDERLPVTEGSSAQQRWAALAIRLALAGELAGMPRLAVYGGAPPIALLLDEPDSNLHSIARARAIEAVVELSIEEGLVTFVATHAVEFLRDPKCAMIHVYRGPFGRAQSKELRGREREGLGRLGLRREDAVHLVRLILLVEGHHDEYVLRSLLGAELDAEGISVVPMHGARNLTSVADSQILADFFDVPIVAMLDNGRQDRVMKYWSGLKDVQSSAEMTLMINEVFGEDRTNEEGFITSLGRRLHSLSSLYRFHVYALAARDIIMYLPVERLVPGASSWEELWDEHQAGLGRSNWPRDFKRWTELYRGGSYDDVALSNACAAIDTPSELLELLGQCRRLARWL